MAEPTDDALQEAAKVVVRARLGDKYEIVGCEQISGNLWEFDVKQTDGGRKVETINIRHDLLVKTAAEKLDVEQLQGKKPLPQQIKSAIMDEYGDGLDSLFEERD